MGVVIGEAPVGSGAPTPARVVIVDDDPLVRAGLSMILGGSPDLLVVAEAEDGEHAQEVVARTRPDVVLMDIRMPRRDGISATSGLLRLPKPPRVIVLTTFETDDQVLAALRAGASGFLLKDTPPPKIVEAIHRVLAGEPMLSPSVTATLIAAATDGVPTLRRDVALAHLAHLTEREREVAVAIGRGWANAEIAAELFMSVATVKAHVTRLFAKLAVENRVQIAMCVHDAGLV
ncbi:response regulator transcription factor [Lapillicoccus sp.]|uniref:response regulator n=1 Tax=Lapillicoccus sp. TaxID=1909287 RepID=UPI0025E2E92C|nr:response regulator transcription factor [Lapillicoccus sp.]